MKYCLIFIFLISFLNCFSQINNAAYFNQDQSNYILVDDVYKMNVTNNFTIEMWIRTERTENWAVLLQEGHCYGGNMSYNLSMQPDSMLYFTFSCVGNCNYYSTYICDKKILPGLCTHVAVSYSSAGVKFYINGESQPGHYSVGSYCGDLHSSDENLKIGVYRYFDFSLGAYFDGGIDDIRIWGRVLNEPEIFLNKDALLTGYENELRFYMNFDQPFAGSGSTIPNLAVTSGTAADGHVYSANTNSPSCVNSCYSYMGIELNNGSEYKLSVFPVPFSEFVIFNIPEFKGNAGIELTDISGRMVFTDNNAEFPYILQRGSLNSGVYFYSISKSNQRIASGYILAE